MRVARGGGQRWLIVNGECSLLSTCRDLALCRETSRGSKEVRSGRERREIGFERFFPHKKDSYTFNTIVLLKALILFRECFN